MRNLFILFLVFISQITYGNTVDGILNKRIQNYFYSEAIKITDALHSTGVSRGDSSGLVKNLKKENITISKRNLVDNRGSLVDAIGVKGKVLLDRDRWTTYIADGRDLSLLILHELYRFNGVNDDSYTRSLPLIVLISKQRNSKEIYCDLNKNLITYKMKSKTFRITGVSDLDDGQLIVNTMKNKVDHSFRNAIANAKKKCSDAGYNHSLKVISAKNSYKTSYTNGFYKRQKTSYLKVKCYKQVVSKKRSWTIKTDFCKKIEACHKRMKNYSDSNFIENTILKLNKLEKDNKC